MDSFPTDHSVQSRGRDGRNVNEGQAPPLPPSLCLPTPPLLMTVQTAFTPRHVWHSIDSMRVPGTDDLIDSKNTLQSHSVAEFAQAADESTVVWHDTGNTHFPNRGSLELLHGTDANGSIWTGFYKQVQGVIGQTAATIQPAVTGNTSTTAALVVAEVAAPNDMSDLDDVANCSDREKDDESQSSSLIHARVPMSKNASHFSDTIARSNSSSTSQTVTAHGGGTRSNPEANGSSNSNGTAESNRAFHSRTSTNERVHVVQDTAVLVHAYLANDDENPKFTVACWRALLVAFLALLATTVLVAVLLTRSNEPTPASETSRPTVTSNDNRATTLTNYINSIKLSSGNFSVPTQAEAPSQVDSDDDALRVYGNYSMANSTSVEEAALAWLIYDDPLKLSPSNETSRFRLRQRYAILTLLLCFEDISTWTFRTIESECEWIFVSNCTVPTGEPNSAYITEIVANEDASTKRGCTLSPDLGLLPNLEYFEVSLRTSMGTMTGTIPSSLGTAWTNLVSFDVYGNALTGSLPSSLGESWSNLQSFDVSFNALTGSIPSLLGTAWTNLRYFDISGIDSKGSLQSSLGTAWTNLQLFAVDQGGVTGSLPSSLGNAWTSLGYFSVSSNALTGSLPVLLGSAWTNLNWFEVRENDLTGRLPPSLGDVWTNLQNFDVGDNALTGGLPSSLGNTWNELEEFDVCDNVLTGTLSLLLGNAWVNLLTFCVSYNALTGRIPSSLDNWGFIEQAMFENNSFVGAMPTEFCPNKTLVGGSELRADCDEVDCPCCTYCCSDAAVDCNFIYE